MTFDVLAVLCPPTPPAGCPVATRHGGRSRTPASRARRRCTPLKNRQHIWMAALLGEQSRWRFLQTTENGQLAFDLVTRRRERRSDDLRVPTTYAAC
jgi:hypothetical protein